MSEGKEADPEQVGWQQKTRISGYLGGGAESRNCTTKTKPSNLWCLLHSVRCRKKDFVFTKKTESMIVLL